MNPVVAKILIHWVGFGIFGLEMAFGIWFKFYV